MLTGQHAPLSIADLERLKLETMFKNSDRVNESEAQIFDSIPKDLSTQKSKALIQEYVFEFLMSENVFIKDLEELIEVRFFIEYDLIKSQQYEEPLMLERWFPHSDHQLLFGGLEEIFEFHKVLSEYLDTLLQMTYEEQKIGSSLLDFVCLTNAQLIHALDCCFYRNLRSILFKSSQSGYTCLSLSISCVHAPLSGISVSKRFRISLPSCLDS